MPLCITDSLIDLHSASFPDSLPPIILKLRLKGAGRGVGKSAVSIQLSSLQFSGRANYGLKSYISGEDRFVRQVEAGLAEEAGYGVFVEAGGVE